MYYSKRRVFPIVAAMLAFGTADQIAAQKRDTPVKVTRIFTGSDNQTHSDEIEVRFVPAPDGTEQADFEVTNLRFFRWLPGHVNDWHPAPQKQYVITLSGRGEVEIAGGQKIAMEPGRIILAEDLTGKGHITRTIGNEIWVRITIPLAEPR